MSAVRCLLTYVLLPLLAPILDLSGAVGPGIGIAVSIVAIVAIVASIRRFFAAHHRLRWGYTTVGSAILVLVVVQAAVDLNALAG